MGAAEKVRRFEELHQGNELFLMPNPWDLGSARLLEALGPTYIKLGQFIASSPSIFPEDYVEEFQRCLDRTPALPFHYIRETIEKELGQSLEQLYQSVDPKPLASASIAQVHAAKLKNGQDVVIKVQRPGVRNVLLIDFNFLYSNSGTRIFPDMGIR